MTSSKKNHIFRTGSTSEGGEQTRKKKQSQLTHTMSSNILGSLHGLNTEPIVLLEQRPSHYPRTSVSMAGTDDQSV